MDLRSNVFTNIFSRAGILNAFLLLFTGLFLKGYATKSPPAHNWTTDPFEQKIFIENKGQFDGKINNRSEKILFGCSNRGVEMYFSAKGLTYRHDVSVPM